MPARAAQTSLPGSIQALVHTRMDRLAAEDKAALQAASVLGQRFAIDALRHLLDRAGYDPRLLVENFLIRADSGEFMFCHALIRDGAYASLLHKRRRALHARAAEWFASRDGVLAAEHFDRADDPRAARGLPRRRRQHRRAVPPRARRWRWSSAASRSRRRRRRGSPC